MGSIHRNCSEKIMRITRHLSRHRMEKYKELFFHFRKGKDVSKYGANKYRKKQLNRGDMQKCLISKER
jgi:hypothetical protein